MVTVFALGAFLVIVLTFALLSAWAVSAVTLLGVALIAAIPLLGVLAPLASDGVGWPLLVTGVNVGLANAALNAALVVGAVALSARGRQTNRRVVLFVFLVSLCALPALLVGMFSLPSAQVVAGVRYMFTPLVMMVVAPMLTPVEVRKIMKLLTILMVAALAFALYQTASGQAALLMTGALQEGINVRGIGGTLRATGSFLTNYHFGAFAAVFAAASLLWWPRLLHGAGPDRWWILTGATVSVLSLALSTFRTGVVLFIVCVLALVMFGRFAIKPWVRVSISIVAAALIAWFAKAGLTDSGSLQKRFAVWAVELSNTRLPFGNGLGYSGAASGAMGSSQRIVTDNYFLSLWLQHGVFGILIVALALGCAITLVRYSRKTEKLVLVSACIAIGMLASFALVEFWEYSSAACLVAFIVGHSLRATKNHVEQVVDPHFELKSRRPQRIGETGVPRAQSLSSERNTF